MSDDTIMTKSWESYDDPDFDQSCGLLGSTCTCYDCETYINSDTVRPIKGKDVTEEEFNETLELCSKDRVIEKMKSERYRSYIYQLIPYPLWSQLEDPEKYQAIVDKLKSQNTIPDEDPEICRIDEKIIMDGIDDTEPTVCTSVSYRFPTSTVKFDLMIQQDGDKILLKTHGRGAELDISE